MSPRALVSGGTGFIGSHLVRSLVQQGWEVHLVLRAESDRTRLANVLFVPHLDDGVMPFHQVVTESAPDVCFHLAGYFVGAHGDGDISRLVNDNILFGTRLVDALSEHPECVLVNAGSYWQNAGGREYHPVGLYAATKQAFHDVLQFYAEKKGVRAATLKFFETYGLGDTRPKLVNLLLRAALLSETVDLSPGRQLVDLVHVDDAVDALFVAAAALQRSRAGTLHEFAVSSGAPISVRQLVRQISRIVQRELSVNWGEREYRWREMMQPWDVAPIVPGWSPKVSLKEGMGTMWQALLEQQSSAER